MAKASSSDVFFRSTEYCWKIWYLYKDSYRLNRVVMADGFKSDNWFLIFYFTLAPFRHFPDTFSRLSSPTQI